MTINRYCLGCSTESDEMKSYKPKIRIDTSGASCWENMNEYFFSEGKEFLEEMNKFFNEHKSK
jgi:hypothetical protein